MHKFIIATALIVVTIPEGLILSVELANSNYLTALIRNNIHVRNIKSSEKLPRITHHIISCEKIEERQYENLQSQILKLDIIVILLVKKLPSK